MMSVLSSIVVCCLIGVGATADPNRPLFAQPKVDPVVHPGVDAAIAMSPAGRARVWVFFTDKAVMSDVAYQDALAEVADGYPARAIRRRTLRRTSPGLFDHRDLPLAEPYVDAVLDTGATLRTRSTWLNAVSVEAARSQIEAVAAMPFVRRILPLARSARVEPAEVGVPGGGATPEGGPTFYGLSWDQLQQINIPAVHAAGYTGQGVFIGILDTGFLRTHEAFNEPGHEVQVLGEWDFVMNDPNAGPEANDDPFQHYHGTYILGTIGAYKPGTLIGGAYDAAFYLAKTEDITSETPIEEDNYVAGLQWIEANGGDVATSSLGYIDWYTQADLDGQTAVTTVAVNIATDNGLVCCTAAGNSSHDSDPGTSHLIAPADAVKVLTCGAVDSAGVIASFSSDGPTADGRTKPEVLARGVGTSTVSPGNDANYVAVSGTSLSTPLVASAVALIVGAHQNWTVSQIRSALLQTGDDYVQNTSFDPLFIRGFGVIDVLAAIEMTFIGDIDSDGDTDLQDFSQFHGCFSGADNPFGAGCDGADMDEDGDVDMIDFSLLQTNFTGPWNN